MQKKYEVIIKQLFSKDEETREEAKKQLNETLNADKKNYFGLFTPYKSIGEFGQALISPLISPLVLSILAGVAAVIAAIAAVAAIGSLIFAGGAALCCQTEAAGGTLEVALTLGFYSGIYALGAAVLALAAAVSAPLNATSIITRSGATVVSAITDGCFKSADNVDDSTRSISPAI